MRAITRRLAINLHRSNNVPTCSTIEPSRQLHRGLDARTPVYCHGNEAPIVIYDSL
ncbi:hypothetical protein BDFB_002528 [Asbolus verrucosus]|uniref:Uncharacterized protein n=1 Tax=Asbolus verrucosus TaxID=1661398 RepID=A0A482VMM7_ASBVE|nr:hypothetical protein BDFB_002528 [Asbolus verrucosus]